MTDTGVIKEVRDGRSFGDRMAEPKVTTFTTPDGKFRKTVSDSWEGPGSYDLLDPRHHPDGQYVRITRVEKVT